MAGHFCTGAPFEEYAKFPAFPNPHIRSNVFLLSRDMLLSNAPRGTPDKLEAFKFESGTESVTNRILQSGHRALVAGADGRSLDVKDWPQSGTFRLGDQSNLLADDNQTRSFDEVNRHQKAWYGEMTWGLRRAHLDI
jgi:hypothetical protein